MQKITEALFGKGVVEGTIDKYYDGKSCVLMCEPANKFSKMQIDLIVSALKSEIGLKYNFGSCLTLPFRINKRIGKERRKCSGHTASAYDHAGFRFWGKEPHMVSPNDILRFVTYTEGIFRCSELSKSRIYIPGTIGIVIDDYSLNSVEIIIESFTGDGKHTFNVIGD